MPGITLQIMVNVGTHDLSYDLMKAAIRHRNGDILAVYPTSDLADLVGGDYKFRDVISSPRSVFVHVRDVPQGLEDKAIRRLIERHQPAAEVFRLRLFRIPPSVVPAATLATLLAEKELTVDWLQAKQFIRQKSITTLLDPTTDDESTPLEDADL